MHLCRLRCAAASAAMCRKEALQVLGLSHKASASDAKQAFRDAAMHWHPDRNPCTSAQTKFMEARVALQVLEGGKEPRFDPILGPRASNGDSLVAREAERLGLRRGVVISAEPHNRKFRTKSVVLILNLGECGDRGILLNGGRSGTGGPDNVVLQTIMHSSSDLAGQGPQVTEALTEEENLFVEAFLDPVHAKKLSKQLEIAREPYMAVFGNLEWGAWGLQEEVATGMWSVHNWSSDDFEFWFHEGRHLSRTKMWENVRSGPSCLHEAPEASQTRGYWETCFL